MATKRKTVKRKTTRKKATPLSVLHKHIDSVAKGHKGAKAKLKKAITAHAKAHATKVCKVKRTVKRKKKK